MMGGQLTDWQRPQFAALLESDYDYTRPRRGQARQAVVLSVSEDEVIVDLGGVDGLIHVSELDWRHGTHPRDVLSVGDEVEVYVLSVDRERERIGLSRKRLLPDPWPRVVRRLHVGQMVDGTVTKVADLEVSWSATK